MANIDQRSTVVVGAGLAGLVAANEWRDAGEPVIVIERDPYVGGMARSIRHDGFTFDLGPHFVFAKTRWHDLLFEPHEFVQFAPKIWMVIDDTWYRYPFSLGSIFKVPLRVQLDFLRTRLFGSRGARYNPRSFAGLMSGIWGSGLFEFFFRPYLTRKMGNTDLAESLHSDWWAMTEHDRGIVARAPVQPAVKGSGLRRIGSTLARAYRGVAYAFRPTLHDYPRGGFGQFAERLSDRFIANGGDLRLSTGIDEIVVKQNRVVSVIADGVAVPVDRLIWTGSPVQLANLLGIEPLTLPTLHAIIYFVEFDRAYPRPGTEVRPIFDGAAFYRSYFLEMISESLVPKGRSGLVAESSTMSLDNLQHASETYENVIDTCVRLGLCPDRSAITHVSHVAIPHCYPIYPLDYEEQLRAFYERLARFENIILAGRNARFQYVNSHQAMLQGMRTREDRLF